MTKENVKKEIANLQNEFSDLMALFEDYANQSNAISSRYSEVKVYVKKRLTELEKLNKLNSLSKYQNSFLLPCIREVFLHCNARVGAKSKQELNSSIYDGDSYCRYWLSQLNL